MNRHCYLTILLTLFILTCKGQNSEKVIIYTETCNELIAGIDNYISILAMQDSSLSKEQISAFSIPIDEHIGEDNPIELKVEKEYGRYLIRPDSIGIVKFHIRLNTAIVFYNLRVKPLDAVCRLGGYKANSESKIPKAIFKAQKGIVAHVECCGFDARCKMLSYEVIRIPVNEISSKSYNLGGEFQETTSNLIRQAESGDLYIFRNIYYRCTTPEKQRSEDMIVEIE